MFSSGGISATANTGTSRKTTSHAILRMTHLLIRYSILQDEDAHVDRIEELQDQIGHMTLPLFLTTQVG
jgi:hypothetical protein